MKKTYSVKTACVLLFAIITFCFFLTIQCKKESAEELKTLAILPFHALQKDPNMTYLGFSLPDQIITKLSYIENILVRSSSAAKHYDPMEYDLEEVARQLDVKYILIGSYSTEKDRLQIDVELFHDQLDESAWLSSYTVKTTEIFNAVDSIANELIKELQVEVSDGERIRLHKDMPKDQSAYEYYLKGIAAKSSSADEYLNRAALLEKSFTLDPSFAPASTELGYAYLQYAGEVGGKSGYYARAKKAILKAYDINDEALKTLYYLGLLYAKTGRSEKAATLFKKGLQINPNSAIFHSGLGYISRYAGLMDESMQSYRRSQILDSSFKNLVATQDQITKSLIYQGSFDAALISHNKMKTSLSKLHQSVNEKQLFYEGVIHFYTKDLDKAFALFDSASALDNTSVWSTFGQAYKQAALSKPKHVQTILEMLEARNIVDGERRYRLVHIYALLRDQENALRNLKLAIEGGFFNYPYLDQDPLLDNIRETKLFKTLLGQAKLRHTSFEQKLGDKF